MQLVARPGTAAAAAAAKEKLDEAEVIVVEVVVVVVVVVVCLEEANPLPMHPIYDDIITAADDAYNLIVDQQVRRSSS